MVHYEADIRAFDHAELQTSQSSVDSGRQNFSHQDSSMAAAEQKPGRALAEDGTSGLQLSRFQACMVLSGVGDALGYSAGAWEFEMNGAVIHKSAVDITGGKGALHLQLKGDRWIVSDDTVLHLAIAEGFMECGEAALCDVRGTCQALAAHLKTGMQDMRGRAPGNGTIKAMHAVAADGKRWDKLPVSKRGGGGCGAAMRSMAVGLRFPRPHQLPWLAAYAVETSKITHYGTLGWFGGFVAAFFTSLAVQGASPEDWCAALRASAPAVRQHIVSSARNVEQLKELKVELDAWAAYGQHMQLPGFHEDAGSPTAAWRRGADWCAPTPAAASARDEHFAAITPCKWPGGTGRGACLIAYDALLAAGADYERLVHCAMLHGGDNDSTGAIAAAWWGARHGMQGVPSCHTEHLEYRQRMQDAAETLLQLAAADA